MAGTVTRAAEETLRLLASTAQDLLRAPARPRDVVISVVTTSEVYVDRMLDLLVEASPIEQSDLGRAMKAAYQDQFHQNWPNRFKWLKDGFGVSISGTREGQEFDTLIALRNSLIHGGGTFTATQSREVGKRIALERDLSARLHVHSGSRALGLSTSTARSAIEISREFVLRLDARFMLAPLCVRNSSLL
jgi:hypothetical protein